MKKGASYILNNDQLFQFGKDILSKIQGREKPVFLCVGSDKFVCDSLGPIVAELLKHEYDIPAYVYGGFDYNINACNVTEAIAYIETIHAGSPIILIDVTLGENVGEVVLKEGCYPALGKTLPIRKVGTISILGVVGRKVANFSLNSTRLKVIMELSRFIAKGCFLVVNYLENHKFDKNYQKISAIN